MSLWRHGLLLASAVLVGAAVPWASLVGAYAPDLTIIAVLIVATRRPLDEAVALGAAAGCLADGLSSAPFGCGALVLGVVAYAGGRLGGELLVANLVVRIVMLAGAVPLADASRALVVHLVQPGEPITAAASLAARVAGTVALGAIVWRPGPAHEERPA